MVLEEVAVQVTTHWYHSSTEMPVNVYVGVVAPVMLVNGPEALADDCHWYVIPDAIDKPGRLSVNTVGLPPVVGVMEAAPTTGVPVQGGNGTIFTI